MAGTSGDDIAIGRQTAVRLWQSIHRIDVIDRVPKLRTKGAHLKEEMKNAIIDNLRYAHEHGTDRPEIVNWTWVY